MNTNTQRLGWGERAPDFVLPCQDGTPTRFYAKAGGVPTLLLFYNAEDVSVLLRFCETVNACATGAVSIFAVAPPIHMEEICFPVFADTQGEVRTAYRLADDEPNILFVLDPNLRVLASLVLEDAASTAQQAISILETALPPVEPLALTRQAPVLLIPNVLAPEICQDLIHIWETQGNVETGVEQSNRESDKDTIRHEHKRRRDHIVRGEKLLKYLSTAIGRRVMPEIHRAFAYRATRFEGFKIACYDAATSGFFRAHRDNLMPSTVHRRFALTLNLNAGYEGGYLRFPEYGPHLYRPAAGEALVFSCSHLHEVTEVTKARRYVLLSFLYGAVEGRSPQAPQ
jgi:predicted 2-oxoglutarate/Fe(II)-dependent dioxygenase YbiX/peroxiredoxin